MRILSLFILSVSPSTIGCSREAAPQGDQRPVSETNAYLLELLRAHGVDAAPHGEWLVLSQANMKANASIVREAPGKWVQLDVRLEFAPGRTLNESFAGIGQTREQATADALHNFTTNSFHVIIAAFFNHGDDQVSRDDWTVGGRLRQVTIGNVGIRGKPPVQGAELVSWFKLFEEKLKAQRLSEGVHWVRLYYAQMQGKSTACEVLLDNDVWEEMQAEMAAIDWPAGEEFYSLRVFLVMQDK